MSEKILVPTLGESITEATVSKWLKKIGETVEADEAIVELETDKVNLEVPSPISGTLSEISFKDGDTVEVGAILGSISKEELEIEKLTETNKQLENNEEKEVIDQKSNIINLDIEKKPQTKLEEPLVLTEDNSMEPKEEQPLLLTEEVKTEEISQQPIVLSPAVRKIVAEKKINLDNVKGTGKAGRILKGDLISMMGANPQPNQRRIKYGEEERIKMTRLRQTIAKRLKQAQENAAMLTTFNEVDMS